MTLPGSVMPICAAAGVLALIVTVLLMRWGGWAGWTLGIIAALVAIAGIGMFAFLAWGHVSGFWWHFA